MKYINPLSKQGFVNLFADYIIKNINPIHRTRIQVVDFKSFLVIYGSTSSEEIIDLNKLRDNFIESHQTLMNYLKLKSVNIIDLIEYKEPLMPQELFFEYYNSQRPIYNKKLIDEINKTTNKKYNFELLNGIEYNTKLEIEFYSPFMSESSNIFSSTNFLATYSTYPHGFSLNTTRAEFYYGEYICNHLFYLLQTDKIIFQYNINNPNTLSDDINVDFKCESMYEDVDVKSLVLDIFDFNIDKFKSDYLSDYDFELDTTNPLDTKPWLVRDKISEMMII